MEECDLFLMFMDSAAEWSLCLCLCFIMDPAPAFAGWDLIWSECTEVQLITVLELAELQPCVNIYLVDKKEQKKALQSITYDCYFIY